MEAINFGRFSIQSDIWSFGALPLLFPSAITFPGVVLYEIFTNAKLPYASLKNDEVLLQLEAGLRLPQPDAWFAGYGAAPS